MFSQIEKQLKKKKGKGKVDEKGLSTLEKDFKFNRYKSVRQCVCGAPSPPFSYTLCRKVAKWVWSAY